MCQKVKRRSNQEMNKDSSDNQKNLSKDKEQEQQKQK